MMFFLPILCLLLVRDGCGQHRLGRKLAIRDYRAVIALFCNGAKGTSALQMSRDMNINPKSAFVLLHKLREAMGADVAAGDELAGTVEIDGAYIGKGPKPAICSSPRRVRTDERTPNRQSASSRAETGFARSRTLCEPA